MKLVFVLLTLLLGTAGASAQPSIQIGPGGVQIDPGGRRDYRDDRPGPGEFRDGPRERRELREERREPREERIVRQEGPCRIIIVRRFDEYGRRTSRRTRECEDDGDE